MFKMSSFFVVLLFLLVFYNQASASEDKAKDFCIQKIADDGCNTCTYQEDTGDWACSLMGCSGEEEEPGKCLKYGKKDSALRNQGQSQEQNQDKDKDKDKDQDKDQGYCIEQIDQYGCNTCYLIDDSWFCTEMGCSGPEGPGIGGKEPGKCLRYAK